MLNEINTFGIGSNPHSMVGRELQLDNYVVYSFEMRLKG